MEKHYPFHPHANQRDARVQNYLGEIYEYGYGVSQSFPKSTFWHRKAAEQGD
jgi:hypothetical protein